jgi:hypothetical protein
MHKIAGSRFPSFVAFWLTAHCAFASCSDGMSVTGTPDAAQADAAEDRSTPPQDRPTVQPDASVPSDDASADASTPPPDVAPPTDTPASPDAGTDASITEDHPLVWCGATFPEPGETCHRELPPGMPRGDFTEVGRGACSPATVSLQSRPSRLNCATDDHGITYMDISPISPGTGYVPCIGNICVFYQGPSMPIRGVQWNPASRIGGAVIWAPGQRVDTEPMHDPSGGTVLY